MENIIRRIRNKLSPDEVINDIEDYVGFDEGNRTGYPSEVCAFDYNELSHALILGTLQGDIVLYGANGLTIEHSIYDKGMPDPTGPIKKIHFMAGDMILILCQGGGILEYKLKGTCLMRVNMFDVPFEYFMFKWPITHVFRTTTDSYTLFFAHAYDLYCIEQHRMMTEVFIGAKEFNKWTGQFCQIMDVSSRPTDTRDMFVVLELGKVVLVRNGSIRKVFTFEHSDMSLTRQLVWDPNGTHVYCITDSDRYLRWKFMIGANDEIFMREIEDLAIDQSGPYPCTPLSHFISFPSSKSEFKEHDIVMYKGGKGRANYDDRNVVTVRRANKAVAFEVTGEIIAVYGILADYVEEDIEGIAVIVTSSELIAIDLETSDWKTMRPMHFFSVNSSTMTCHIRVPDIDENIFKLILENGDRYWEEMHYSSRILPIFCGDSTNAGPNKERPAYRQIHLTGHSTGNIILWAAGGRHMFKSGQEAYEAELEPGVPVAVVGHFDPFEDDLHLAIAQLYLDEKKGTVMAVNRGGYVLVYDLYNTPITLDPTAPKKIKWTTNLSCDPCYIEPRNTPRSYNIGYQPTHENSGNTPLMKWFQQIPNVYTNAIDYNAKFKCLVIGTECGYAFLNVRLFQVVHLVDSPMPDNDVKKSRPNERKSRFRSFKKSLRRTFRRKKTSRNTTRSSLSTTAQSSPNRTVSEAGQSSSGHQPKAQTIRNSTRSALGKVRQGSELFGELSDDYNYVERQIEARRDLASTAILQNVTCIKTMRMPLTNKTVFDDLVAIGTNGGKIIFYRLTEANSFSQRNCTFEVTKVESIRLEGDQAVKNMELSCEDGFYNAATTRLVVFTEEQIRFYSFPGKVKAGSYKMTQLEGLRIKCGAVVKLQKVHEPSTSGMFALVIANNGEMRIHSLEDPTVFYSKPFIENTDLNALNTVVISKYGEITYLHRWCELKRFAVNSAYRGWYS
ncbi:unnamed protein product [Caenorhabditis bovis]|uniref:Lethal giant larvae homologue 2 domain-containing protein n=1 Tax=Caenorhabditis bovis TaxID=2654633 RepID=A0A8S1EB77_9PELO|nr:unnamed protein product [Caenorhabditis bovis]